MKNRIYSNSNYGYTIKLGYAANQANGSVWLQHGETVILATAVKELTDDFPGFFPLSVEHRELFSSVGKIPGGYFKREGKPTDKEVLTGRIIDRTLRPLFPENYFDKLQIVSNVYSLDKNHLVTSLSLMAVSLALSLSDVPFLECAGCCEVAKVNDKWVFYPTHDQVLESSAKLIVAGTKDGINMVEGAFEGLSEGELVDILFKAHEEVKKQIAWQEEIIADCEVTKDLSTLIDTTQWTKRSLEFLTDERVKSVFLNDKLARSKALKIIQQEFSYDYEKNIEEEKISKNFVLYVLDNVLKDKITDLVLSEGKRIDGRPFDKVRDISVEVGVLPRNHGSSLFTRGRTQLLCSTTLGSGNDESKIESLLENKDGQFMLHYNFLPLSVGEAKPIRAPGRREIGHGHLAANAIRAVLPTSSEFPYVIRIVADTLESDGSTSMATVCGTTMALMDAGVPIKGMVAGIAMGMLEAKHATSSENKFKVLTDIAGFEDAFGLMDFKIAGTESSITAIQMDIKYKGGLPKNVFKDAIREATKARLHILSIMKTTQSAPNEKLSNYVPQFVVLKINKEKIGAVIGSGGKTIKEITALTQTSINIEDDGTVKVFGQPGEGLDKAASWIKLISGDIQNGMDLVGTVKKIAEFGYFVELAPQIDGLVHISSIPRSEQENFKTKYREGDKVNVNVSEYDPSTGRIRLKITE